MWIVRPITVDDTVLASTNVAETDYTEYNAGTIYNTGNRVMRASLHKNFECAADGVIGIAPESDPTKWIDLGATNAWAMFDTKVTTKTTNASSIDVTFDITGAIGTVALLNVAADQVQVIMTDAVEGIVYDKTSSLIESASDGWYAYFFGKDTYVDQALFMDLPPYLDASVQLIISGATAVSCGLCAIGLQKEIGKTQYGLDLGIIDYSAKTVDPFGNTTFIERDYSNRADYNVRIPSSRISDVRKTLATYRAQPILYVASADRAETAVFGKFNSFNIIYANAINAYCAITIEGLI